MNKIGYTILITVTLTVGAFLVGCSSNKANAASGSAMWEISGDTFSHDPSVIYAENRYWEFFTANGIGRKYSDDGKIWSYGGQVFSKKLSWWSKYVPGKTDFNIWAPDIVLYDGTYYLFYSVSTFGSRVSCIGLASCTNLASNDWTDCGVVINSTNKSKYNCIDPSFFEDNGTVYLAFGSWSDGIYLTQLDKATLKAVGTPTQIATRNITDNAIEGCCIWAPGNGYYYLFASYDRCCAGKDSTYNIRYGRSQNVAGPYVDERGKSMLDGGGTFIASSRDRYIGPGGEDVLKTAAGTWALCYHYYDALTNGTSRLMIQDLTVNDEGWILHR